MGKIRDYILWTLKGIGIGAANVIPGVSGGTAGPDGLLVDEDGVIIE